MSDEADNDGKRPSNPALAIGVTCWVLTLMTAVIACYSYAQLTGRSFIIPQFIIDVFVTVVNVAIGAAVGGTGLALAAAAYKAIERKKDEESNAD